MNINTVFFDLDGTLLADDKTLRSETADALNELHANNINVVIATGRNFNGAMSVLKGINSIKYIITSNGAAIFEVSNPVPILRNEMKNELVLSLCDLLDMENIIFDPFINGQAYTEEKNIEHIKNLNVPDSVKEFIIANRKTVPSITDLLKTERCDVEKVTINFKTLSDGTLFKREETINIINSLDILSCVTGGSNNVEVTLKDATKGNAIIKVLEMLNSDTDSAMAFGDSENDLDMIKTVKYGIAMGNAQDIVKNSAYYIAKSNNENGVAKALKELNIL